LVKVDRSIIGMKFDLSKLLRDSGAQAVSIGRSRSNDIAIPDLSLSKSHAAICLQQGVGLVLKDVGSTHGSFVNDRRVCASGLDGGFSASELCILHDGDKIRLGRVECLLVLRVGATEAANDRPEDSSAAVISKG
jgi:pSer/pThr/pTyr-binding forkhead associated (FHA) protein